jgi:hypothetical protein
MYLFNPKKAQLIKKNRSTEEFVYDDEDVSEPITIDVIPYNVDQALQYGIYTVPEATGYFIVRSKLDIREGDMIIFQGRQYSVLHIRDNWVFNKVENIEVAIK